MASILSKDCKSCLAKAVRLLLILSDNYADGGNIEMATRKDKTLSLVPQDSRFCGIYWA